MNKTYYFFYLEIALRNEDDLNIYAFNNVSHIPTSKLVEIFNIDLESDPNISEGYFLTESIYNNHKQYIDENVGQINLTVFEYCLRLYVAYDDKEVRSLYKEDVFE